MKLYKIRIKVIPPLRFYLNLIMSFSKKFLVIAADNKKNTEPIRDSSKEEKRRRSR